MQSFVPIGGIAYEKFDGAGPISRDSGQFSERVDIIFECATKYMGVISQNALSLIIAPHSVGNSQGQYTTNIFRHV